MLKFFSKVLSVLMHPLLMPLIGILIIFNSGTYLAFLPAEIKRFVYWAIFFSTVVLPLFIIPIFFYSNIIENIYMQSRKERILPVFITTVIYFLTYYWFKHQDFSPILQSYILSIAIITFATLIISFFWKISLHMIGIGGILGLIYVLSAQLKLDLVGILLLGTFLAGLLGSARLKLESHKPAQVYFGFLFGLCLMIFLLQI